MKELFTIGVLLASRTGIANRSMSAIERFLKSAVFSVGAIACLSPASAYDSAQSIEGIAHDIALLKVSFPQLKDFSVAEHLNIERHTISYGYSTREPEGQGGWTSGVPNPDNDGIWFYIDLHDPNSTAQIHTQPMSSSAICIGSMKLSFLMLEGPETKSVEGAVWEILRKHGAAECEGQ